MKLLNVLFLFSLFFFITKSSSLESVSFIFSGDTVLDDEVGEEIAKGNDPFIAFNTYFSNADIRITNLECVIATLGDPVDKFYTFRAHPRVIPILKRHFDAVALANNHSGDYGPIAFTQMLDLLSKADLKQVGGGHNLTQAHKPLIFTRRGIRVAVLSYNEFHPRSFEAGYDHAGVAWSEDEQVVADIQDARRHHLADVVIPIMHWGWENELKANPRQKQLSRLMIDAGADAVIGGHPHVTQEVDIYLGKPIIYSVGNFVMKEVDNDNQKKGWVVKLDLDRSGVLQLGSKGVKINANGIPSIDHLLSGPCWSRGQEKALNCF